MIGEDANETISGLTSPRAKNDIKIHTQMSRAAPYFNIFDVKAGLHYSLSYIQNSAALI